MTIYEEFQGLHKVWHERQCDAWNGFVRFTHRFRDGLREYIGAPEYFRSEMLTKGKRISYVSLVKVAPLDHNEKYTLSDVEDEQFHQGHISEEEEDGLVFGLKVYVDSSQNTWPKHPFWFRLAMKPIGSGGHLSVFRQKFEIDMRDESTWVPVFEHITSELRRELLKEPGATFTKEQQRIGFLHPVNA